MDRIVDFKELRTIVPYGRSQIARMEKAGRFPKRIKLGKHRVGWSLAEVMAWIQARKSERGASNSPAIGHCALLGYKRPLLSNANAILQFPAIL